MKKLNFFNRIPLFKSKKSEIPDYTTFQLLLEKHNNSVTLPLLCHFRNTSMKLLVYSYRKHLALLTCENYEKAVTNLEKLKDVVKSWYEDLAPDAQFIIQNYIVKTSSMSIKDISANVKCSMTTVRRQLDRTSNKLFNKIHSELFDGIPCMSTCKAPTAEAFEDPRIAKVTKPISNNYEGRNLIINLCTTADLSWTLPSDSSSELWNNYCIAAGKLFGLVSLKTAVGARILLEGGSHKDVQAVRVEMHLEEPSDENKNYRHCKRSFIKFLKSHQAEADKILAEVMESGNSNNVYKSKN